MKRCSCCHLNKPRSAFWPNRGNKDGLQRECVECMTAAASSYLARHPYELSELCEQYRPANLQEAAVIRARQVAAGREKNSLAAGANGHIKARKLVRQAIAWGELVRGPCEVCGDTRAQAHHRDYSRPLDVEWLCRRHHTIRHIETNDRLSPCDKQRLMQQMDPGFSDPAVCGRSGEKLMGSRPTPGNAGGASRPPIASMIPRRWG
jgi:hypothetical protein